MSTVASGSGAAARAGERLRRQGALVALAESCTGGLVAARLSAVAGASDFLWGGVVVYSDAAKCVLLGIDREELGRHGPVSAATTRALARAVRERAGAAYGLAVTGWAGPAGGTPEDPVGSVFVALAGPDGVAVCRRRLAGDRDAVRRGAADLALRWLAGEPPEEEEPDG